MTITLATLKDATRQEVFNQVARHLLKQGEQCLDIAGNCKYRYGGLKCAAGALIADGEYVPEMDIGGAGYGTSWHSLISRDLVKVDNHHKLIGRLQAVHDAADNNNFAPGLREVASRFNLDVSAVEGL